MNKEIKYEKCPICGKGCDVNELKCCRGKKFIRLLNNGEITAVWTRNQGRRNNRRKGKGIKRAV